MQIILYHPGVLSVYHTRDRVTLRIQEQDGSRPVVELKFDTNEELISFLASGEQALERGRKAADAETP